MNPESNFIREDKIKPQMRKRLDEAVDEGL